MLVRFRVILGLFFPLKPTCSAGQRLLDSEPNRAVWFQPRVSDRSTALAAREAIKNSQPSGRRLFMLRWFCIGTGQGTCLQNIPVCVFCRLFRSNLTFERKQLPERGGQKHVHLSIYVSIHVEVLHRCEQITSRNLLHTSGAKPQHSHGSYRAPATPRRSRQQDGAELRGKTAGRGKDGTRDPADAEGIQLQGRSDLSVDQSHAPCRRTGGRCGGHGGPMWSQRPTTPCYCKWHPPTSCCCKQLLRSSCR